MSINCHYYNRIYELANKIEKPDSKIEKEVKKLIDNQGKPIESLGKLEDLVVKICSIISSKDPNVKNRANIIMCADNGVVDEKVSSCPKEVTYVVTENFTKGIAAINALSESAKCDLVVVDIGVDYTFDNKDIIDKKIMYGTNNFTKSPAMDKKQVTDAIMVGINLVKDLKDKGYTILSTGEMGIGNTTTSSAILSVLSGTSPSIVTGRGSGLDDSSLAHKIKVIEKGIKINSPDKDDPIDVLRKVGGLDIAGLVGIYLGGAIYKVPIIMDGFISGVAALVSTKINPWVKDYIIPSHCSLEPGMVLLFEQLDFEPMLIMNMRLGEGTGAVLIYNIIDSAFNLYRKMGDFESAHIDKYNKFQF